MITFFAHGGEVHETASESTMHILSDWYIALPLFILVIAGFAALVYLATKRSKPVTYLSVVGLLLVAGVFMYDKSPVVSIVSLAVGMAMILASVLGSLMLPHKKS